MRSFYFFILLLAALLGGTYSSAADRYWVGPIGGSYSNGANWNTASNGSGSSGAPTSADNVIVDRNATILIDGNYFPSSVQIKNSSIVEFTTSFSRTLTIGGGAVSPAFLVEAGSELDIIGTSALTIAMYSTSQAAIYGILDFSGTNSKMDYAASGTTTIKTGGMIRYGGNSSNGTGTLASFKMEDNSTFEIYKNGGTFPTGTYHPNSNIINSGAISSPATFLMSSSVGSYGNYIFDCPDFTATGTGVNMNVTFNEFSLLSTGFGRWVFSTSPSSAYVMNVNSNFTVGPDAIMEINKASSGSQTTAVKVAGDVSIDGLVTESGNNTGSLIELLGNQDAYFFAAETAMENDISLTLNKTGGAIVYANSDVYMSPGSNAILTLTSGMFDMNFSVSNMIIRNPVPAAVVGGTLSSHVIGTMKRFSAQAGSFSFPVSNSADQLAKAVITTNSNSATEWTVDFVEPNSSASTGLTPGTIDQVSDYYWNILRDGLTPSDASGITLHYGDLINPGLSTLTQLKVVYNNGAIWQNMGGIVSTGNVTNSLGSNGTAAPADPIADFGDFAIGGVSNTLPVDIEYFTGRRSGKKHDLSWRINCTATPSVTMMLERSADAGKFDLIHSLAVDAERCQQAFSYTDAQPLPGRNYYRLAVKDLDGVLKYSRIISLFNPGDKPLLSGIYPNPAAGSEITAEISSPSSLSGELRIVDNLGRSLSRRSVNISTGLNKIPLDISGLAPGQYRVVWVSEDRQINVLGFVKSR